MLKSIGRWLERRRAIRRRWRAAARALVVAGEVDAYYEAQRRAARARVRGNRAEFHHWAKVAAKVARIAPSAEMDIGVLQTLVADEERRAWSCRLRAAPGKGSCAAARHQFPTRHKRRLAGRALARLALRGLRFLPRVCGAGIDQEGSATKVRGRKWKRQISKS